MHEVSARLGVLSPEALVERLGSRLELLRGDASLSRKCPTK